MRNILYNYPQPNNPRIVRNKDFQDRIIASYRDKNFFNGSRNTGYGTYKYDGRWQQIAKNCINLYNLKDNAKILNINCEYGFLLYDLLELNNTFDIYGTETSQYAIDQSPEKLSNNIKFCDPRSIDFPNNYFDLVIGLGVVYTLNLPDGIKLLKIISNISKDGNSFITLATYDTEEEKKLFEGWTLAINLCLRREEWKLILKEANYIGDYLFVDSNYLNLVSN